MLNLFYCCVVAVMFSSCVLPQGTASPTKSSQSSVVFSVNGTAVTNEELMKSPHIRQGLEQVLLLHGLKSMVAVEGVSLEENAIEDKLDEMKGELLASGKSFNDFLEMQGTNEADFKENLRIGLLWESLLESRLEYTEDALKELWEANPGRYSNMHARENSLTDNEKETLTFEEVRDTVFETFKNDEFQRISGGLQQEILDSVNLSLTCISDSTERKYFEDLIINKKKSTYVAPETLEPEGETEAADPIPIVVDEESHESEAAEDANPCESSDEDAGDGSGEDETPKGE